ncbi:MAG: ClpXP protease specificity-enhancing factor SspB [Alphaproteobacteria bacterium]|nr:ClpXP protease specificity-enhancing factor SspB [Alphaproteobacteria bacterium]
MRGHLTGGVDVPGYLRDRYPDELTIVLQHQFWGLEVTEKDFSVTLSFNKAREYVCVPFAALTRFADPGVKFGMQFEIKTAEGPGKLQLVGAAEEALANAEDDESAADGVTEIGANGDELAEPAAADADVDAVVGGDDTEEAPGEVDSGGGEDDAEAAPEAGGSGEAGAEVVTLDSFRKK